MQSRVDKAHTKGQSRQLKPEASRRRGSHIVDRAVRNDSIKGWAAIHKEHCDVGALGARGGRVLYGKASAMACSLDLLAPVGEARRRSERRPAPQDESLEDVSQLKAISLESLGGLRRDSLGTELTASGFRRAGTNGLRLDRLVDGQAKPVSDGAMVGQHQAPTPPPPQRC